jgi:hypothetical protein
MRTAAFIVGATGLAILLWLYSLAEPTLGEFIAFVVPAVPAIAAYFAFASARAAERNLQDQRARRAAEVRPFLTLDVPQPPRWALTWDGLARGGVKATERSRTPISSVPCVVLRNFGGGPAIQPTLTFEILDPPSNPLNAQALEVLWKPPNDGTCIRVDAGSLVYDLEVREPQRVTKSSQRFILEPREEIHLSHISVGEEPTVVNFPTNIMNFIFFHSAMATRSTWQPILRVTVRYQTRDRQVLGDEFKIRLSGSFAHRDMLPFEGAPPPYLRANIGLDKLD